MFLASRKKEYQNAHQMQLGTTTIGGNPAGVYLAGERRNLSIMAPKGYSWTPSQGDGVLVLKSGEQGECSYIAGVPLTDSLPAGTIQISNEDGSAYISLDDQGNLYLVGNVFINGEAVLPTQTEEVV